ncbi:MAG TPA: (2Fe-2S) ferredoxin domain-containing protein [Thiothrix sp.]|nr:(2Fe-2S) ferredoxin domain-containing protein [Thiothrix sp.]
MSYYQYHLFFCTNQRADGSNCCAKFNAQAMRDYAKQKSKDLGLVSTGKVRVNSAGCLNRCEKGPVAVVYPEGVWYSYLDEEDIDEIMHEHLLNGRIVERLKVDVD